MAGDTDGANEFFKFEKCLVKNAKESKKKQLLKQQAISVISKSKDALNKFRQDVNRKQEATEGQHKKDIASLQSGIDNFKKKRQEKYDIFDEGEIEAFKKEISEDGTGKGSGKSRLKRILEKVDARRRAILDEFEMWMETRHFSNRARITKVPHDVRTRLNSEKDFWFDIFTTISVGCIGIGR